LILFSVHLQTGKYVHLCCGFWQRYRAQQRQKYRPAPAEWTGPVVARKPQYDIWGNTVKIFFKFKFS
jgi:hypothetical protein